MYEPLTDHKGQPCAAEVCALYMILVGAREDPGLAIGRLAQNTTLHRFLSPFFCQAIPDKRNS